MASSASPLRTVVLAGSALSAALWAYACGDGATEPAPTPDPPRPTTLTVTPATAELSAIGATVQLTAEVRDQNGSVMGGVAVAWASSDAAVATVDASGLATATGNGTATITATAGSASGIAVVAVAQVATAVIVTPPADTLVAFGYTVRLAAEAMDANGHPVAGAEFSWASSDTTVAVVDSAGLVTAADNGTTTITATAGSSSGAAAVTVAQEVSTVAISPAADTMVVGDTARLAAEATDANGHAVVGAGFGWASSNPEVAGVDSTGLVAAVSAGAVEITATTTGVTGRSVLAVLAPVPTTVTVTPDTLTFTALGQSAELAAELRDQAGRVMTEAAVSWSSADTLVVTVDSAGLVTAVGTGSTTVAATAGEARGEALATVMQSAGSVVVKPAADTIAPGDMLRLLAEVFDENGHPVEGATLTWSSTDVSVARVDGSGLVTGAGEGTATITAAAGDARGTAAITVENPDRAALVALYNATDGPNWVNNENWLTDAPLGSWYGVETDAMGRVVVLDLGSSPSEATTNGLSGPIPPELGGLAELTSLNFAYNSLSGSIPSELGHLADLVTLDLSWNSLTGSIPPALGNLTSLRHLALDRNPLSGPIPPELGGLVNLQWLNLSIADLSGPIPPELGNLTQLMFVRLIGNNLSGPIPAELGNLVDLRTLNLAQNELTGAIPAELGNLANLTWLYLARNKLTGPIPQSLLQLESLQAFIIGRSGLCVPGSSAFAEWLTGIESHDADETHPCNAADIAVLEALYETARGRGWTESSGWLTDRALEGWHGVTADSLGHVTELDLARNGLTGRLPPTLSDLERMTALRIGENDLRGRLPLSLTRVHLREFRYAGTGLCAPAEEQFQTWLSGISSHEGTGVQCTLLSDRDLLEALYRATNGPDWIRSDNWLTDAPLRDWYGVAVDGEERVAGLHLPGIGLTGPIPPELGGLVKLTSLSLSGNSLTGSIPPELGGLARLTSLSLGGNHLTGPIPAELGNLANLVDLSLGGNGLTGPIPPELGGLARLSNLSLGGNSLTGSIPPELGGLARLTSLSLGGNGLTGSIPPELGGLARLTSLSLSGNILTGPIPPELGNVASLTHLRLFDNDLSGPIPPELGGLARLTSLSLGGNNLTGAIPPELGNVASLTHLWLFDNDLSGAIPPEFGGLSTLEELELTDNDLSGPVPPEFGAMASLRRISFSANADMAGALPIGLTTLHRLDALLAGGTDLCAPADRDFQAWLEGVQKRRIKPCAEGGPPAAYLTQAVQSRDFPVPLVAGERALLRVFVTARQATAESIPLVRARFYRSDRETHVVDIPGKSVPIPTEVREGRLSTSVNTEIPGEVIQPGLEMVIEVDPDGMLDPALGVVKRIPATGRLAVDVRAVPPFDLTLIPFVWSETHDSSIVDVAGAIAADPEGHRAMWSTHTLLPIGDLDVTAHEPVLSSSNNAFTLLNQTEAIRVMEGAHGHYMGAFDRTARGATGVAILGGRSSFVSFRSVEQPTEANGPVGHELGHNLGLAHAPCGNAGGPDPSFPYPDGSIGTWGYDFRGGGSLVHPVHKDIMSYCFPSWISDYYFTNALAFRVVEEEASTVAASTATSQSLLLWGGVGADSTPYLEPAFVVDAPAVLPDSAGAHRITGRTANGRELFSLSFTMPVTADGDGNSGFAFVLPVQAGWDATLAAITLSGPEGSVTLDGHTDLPMAILRNPRTGQVRGFLRDLPPATRAARDAAGSAAGSGLQVLFSRGIPGADAWRR